MQSRQFLYAVFAGVFSLVVVIGSLMGRTGSDSVPMRDAVVVNQNLDAGTTLSAEMLSTIRFPANHLPPDVGTELELFQGRVLNHSMRKNQLLYQSDLAPEDSPQTLQSKISKGSRGYSIPLITPSAGVAGFALPGSRVDVLSSPSARRGQESQESLTVVENVQVLAVDNIAVPEDAPSNPKTMTLLLTPEQTRRVDQAQAKGPLRLSLRNSDDADVIDIPEGEVSVNAPNTSETIAASPVSLTSDSGHQPALPLNVLVFRESMASVSSVRRVKTRRPSKPPQTVQTTPRVNFPAH